MHSAFNARSAVAVATGFIVIGVLAFGTDALVRAQIPSAYESSGRMESVAWLLFTQAYVFLYATIGCWLAARLAPDRPMRHALLLGWLGLAFNVVGSAAQWSTVPVWYHVVALALVMPAAWLGGRIRERQLVETPIVAPSVA